ncbi:MAG: 2-octaprenyl-6-methoxyphenyl hydroxylase [Halothiobacillaceae bacterium]|jgi:2-octaprenyl-6-methoxyphenol hydroxylase|nr:2-octaprenyl-6-methoxyphenyl hydroxylase [Halothiobacillaceae bacterium]MDY0050067.1 2-octaprenyl-6-methoxyphenyl hydroxylase [Halothiobacillaceae bacterium]
MDARRYDIVIVGGGLVGASLALSLSGQGWRIALVEAVSAEGTQPSFDGRLSALAAAAVSQLDALGVWAPVAAQAAPIRRIHVSERGRYGCTRLDAGEENVPALGWVIANRVLGEALMARLTACADVERWCPYRFDAFEADQDGCRVLRLQPLEAGGEAVRLEAALVVGADGAHSAVRDALGIAAERHDYGQTAFMLRVRCEHPAQGVAWERFTDSGPLAFLPMADGRYAVVWTVREAQVEALRGLDDAALLARLQDRFGWRVGRLLAVEGRESYPLIRVFSAQPTAGRALVLGNAAHTLHPVAGQGFNLCLRDIRVLTDLLRRAHERGADPGEASLLASYVEARCADYRRSLSATDTLARLFLPDLPGLGALRGVALALLDSCPPARHRLAQVAMGWVDVSTPV